MSENSGESRLLSGMGAPTEAPRWVTHALVPLVNLALALFVSGLLITALGEDPFEAISILAHGAFGYPEAIGYTLYYTTNFIFTGLAVAIAAQQHDFRVADQGSATPQGTVFVGGQVIIPPVVDVQAQPGGEPRRHRVAVFGHLQTLDS